MSESANYTVTANRLNLRADPGVDSAVLGVLQRGTVVTPDGDLASDWWHVRTPDNARSGYVARRYLAPISAAAPPIPDDAATLLWTLTESSAGRVTYKLGAKHSAQGRIDCSGWVCELTQAAFTAVNKAAAPEIVFERSDFGALDTHSDGIVSGIERRTGFVLHGTQITPAGLRPGMLLGMDYGAHKWELGDPPRVYGIDHIVQVMRDPATGLLWITQSSSSGGGVNRILLNDWIGAPAQAKLRLDGRMHAVDPFLMADRNTRFVGLRAAVKALEIPAVPAPVAAAPGAAVTGGVPAVGAAAFELIIEFEVGSRAVYEKKLLHPIWPQAGSGVTIGIGHDLGFTTPEAFDRNWAGLPPDSRARLRDTIGKTREDARACIPAVKDIVVPWTLAEGVFRNVDVPRTAARTAETLPNCDKLSGESFGVLVSLGYNRGLSYREARKPGDTIDRYKEMRAICALMESEQFDLIPAQIRAMKRIWRGTAIEGGMNRRRDAEADLFAKGLKEAADAATSAALPAPEDEAILHPEVTSSEPADESFVDETEDDIVASAKAAPAAGLLDEADLVAQSQVTWASDDKGIDYAHLRTLPPQGTRFALRADDLERLYALNSFPEDHGGGDVVLFGLRGCGILAADDRFADEVILVDRRPDHATARCVMGVWNRATRQIAVFPASTVPNVKAVTGWQRTRKSGNLLPTGFYRYITGTHNGRPGCLILRKTAAQPRTVVVRRSSNDLRYERTDLVDVCAPGDNIHPSFRKSEAEFSSFGCQVVVGSADGSGNHTGPWARFRAAIGLPERGAANGLPFGYMLLTGAEANMASMLRRAGTADDAADWNVLKRLRFGSHGDAVKRLQAVLELSSPDGDFGPNTSERFHQRQRALFEGRCDGICSPEVAKTAQWQIF